MCTITQNMFINSKQLKIKTLIMSAKVKLYLRTYGQLKKVKKTKGSLASYENQDYFVSRRVIQDGKACKDHLILQLISISTTLCSAYALVFVFP